MFQCRPTVVILPILHILLFTIFSSPVLGAPCSSVTTFNMGLTTNYQGRLPRIIEELRKESSDLYCLQEVWLESDMDLVTSTLADLYPHHFSAVHYRTDKLKQSSGDTSQRSACSHTELSTFTSHVVLQCGDKHGCLKSVFDFSSLVCLTVKCGDQFTDVNQHCISCIALMGSSMADWAQNCGPNPLVTNNAFNPSGLLMLSKQPMVYATHRSFYPEHRPVVDRGYLEAAVMGVGKVACTHLTPVLPTVYFEYDRGLPFNDSASQQAAEINILRVKFNDSDHVIMGDLNTGPHILSNTTEKNLTGASQENLKLLLHAGYRSPYYETDGRCSYCESNPLSHSGHNLGIDHVMVRGSSISVMGAARVMDQVTPPCSDHFGVKVSVCPAMRVVKVN